MLYRRGVSQRRSLDTTASHMVVATRNYLDSLNRTQRIASIFPFDEPHRRVWEFEPLGAGNPRFGVPWPDLGESQRALATRLIALGLGHRGLRKAETIREIEKIQHPDDGTRSYCLWFYGSPSMQAPWTWRYEGHHLSVAITIDGCHISNTPIFLGVSPTFVRDNKYNRDLPIGTRAMAVEEDLSNALWKSLDEEQREVSEIPLPDLPDRTPHVARIERGVPQGIRIDLLGPDQQAYVRSILRTALGNVAPALASARYKEFLASDRRDVWLATARASFRSLPMGHTRPDGYYYRIQGPTFLLEYDDVQWGWQDSGHIHSIWRDFDGDFGKVE
jgi:hypothetical protein